MVALKKVVVAKGIVILFEKKTFENCFRTVFLCGESNYFLESGIAVQITILIVHTILFDQKISLQNLDLNILFHHLFACSRLICLPPTMINPGTPSGR